MSSLAVRVLHEWGAGYQIEVDGRVVCWRKFKHAVASDLRIVLLTLDAAGLEVYLEDDCGAARIRPMAMIQDKLSRPVAGLDGAPEGAQWAGGDTDGGGK